MRVTTLAHGKIKPVYYVDHVVTAGGHELIDDGVRLPE
jgi:hypothetical protein